MRAAVSRFCSLCAVGVIFGEGIEEQVPKQDPHPKSLPPPTLRIFLQKKHWKQPINLKPTLDRYSIRIIISLIKTP